MNIAIQIDLITIFCVTCAVIACMVVYYWIFFDHSSDDESEP